MMIGSLAVVTFGTVKMVLVVCGWASRLAVPNKLAHREPV